MPEEPSPNPSAGAVSTRPPRHGKRTLKQRAMRGSAWTFLGFGFTQFVRFAGNIVVARLLAPEVFGIMMVVWAVMFAISLLSDVGSGAAVVRHERGDEPDFLNTAWTMQVIRGFVMFSVACLLAWPMSLRYEEPLLLYILPVVGFTAIVDGFVTMKMFTATRRLALGRQTMVEFLSQTTGVVVMVVLAYQFRSIWALVAGTVTTRIMRLIIAQFLLPGLTNWFRWEREAVRELVIFGKWMLSSSVLMVVGKTTDKFMLPLLDSAAVGGVYDRANRLSDPFQMLSMQLSRKVVFPAMSSVHRDRPKAMRKTYYRARLLLDAAFLPILGALMITAPIFVYILYDDRYAAAGWMLQILMIRIAMQCVLEPSRECLIALNKPQYAFWLTLGRTVWVMAGVPLGWYLAGLPGLIWAVGLSEVPVLVVVWYGMQRHRLLNLRREAFALLLVGLGILAGWGFTILWTDVLVEYWDLFEAWLRIQWQAGAPQ